MYRLKTMLNRTVSSTIADWYMLNSNELAWIALISVGVLAIGMSM